MQNTHTVLNQMNFCLQKIKAFHWIYDCHFNQQNTFFSDFLRLHFTCYTGNPFYQNLIEYCFWNLSPVNHDFLSLICLITVLALYLLGISHPKFIMVSFSILSSSPIISLVAHITNHYYFKTYHLYRNHIFSVFLCCV